MVELISYTVTSVIWSGIGEHDTTICCNKKLNWLHIQVESGKNNISYTQTTENDWCYSYFLFYKLNFL